MKKVLFLSSLLSFGLILSACGSEKDGANSAPLPATPFVDSQMRLKSAGVKKVLVDAKVDLRKFLVNGEAAIFRVTEGDAISEWAELERPVLHFQQVGDVVVEAVDGESGVKVTLEFQVVFDTVTIPGTGAPDLTIPDIPVTP